MYIVVVYVSEDMKQGHVEYYDLVVMNSLDCSLTNVSTASIKFVILREFPLENCCTVEFNSFV